MPVQHLKTIEQETGNTENELHCIPEYRSEDSVNTVKQIGKTVRFTLKDEKKLHELQRTIKVDLANNINCTVLK